MNKKVRFTEDGILDKETQIEVTKYAAKLLNEVREALGTTPFEITQRSLNDSSTVARLATKYWGQENEYENKYIHAIAYGEFLGHNCYDISPDVSFALERGEQVDISKVVTVDDLHHAIYNTLAWSLFHDEDGGWLRLVYLSGLDKINAPIYLGVQVTKRGRVHIDINDDKFREQGSIHSGQDMYGNAQWYRSTVDDSPRIPID